MNEPSVPAPAPPPSPLDPPLAYHPAARPAPWATALRLLLPLAIMMAFVATVVIGLAAGARWLLLTEGGSRWLVGLLPGVQVEGLRGALLGEQIAADRLTVRWGSAGASAVIEAPDLRGIAWRWHPADGAVVGLEIASVNARRVVVDPGAPSGQPLRAPGSLAAPFIVRVAALRIDELKLAALEPIGPIDARAAVFDGRAGARHGVESLALRGYGVAALLAEASLGNQAPLPLEARLTLTPALHPGDAPPWAAVLRATGPLAALDVTAVLRGVGRKGTPAPQAELAGHVRPFDTWPVDRLEARTESLDLASLAAGLPQTQLAGRVEARAARRDAPIAAAGRIENRLPGRWNEGRLPVSRLDFEVSGTLAERERIELSRVELQFADAGAPAGRLSGRARWTGHTLQGEVTLADLLPQRLDGRAPAMTLRGPLRATVRGLPSPDPQAAGARPPWGVEAGADLEGGFAGAPTPVQLAAAVRAAPGRVEIESLRARAGNAVAELTAMLARPSPRAYWQLQTRGTLADFDPQPWWPGPAGSAWRQGPHRLNGDWAFDLRLPPWEAKTDLLTWAPRLAGNGRLRLQDSLLAGVALAGNIELGYTPAAAIAPGSLRLDLTAGGNRIQVEGRGDPAGTGEHDRWQAEVQAPALTRLAPLARLHPALADWLPSDGRAEATLAAEGRWPVLASEGQVRIEQLRAGALALRSGSARWSLRLGQGPEDPPLALALDVSGLQIGAQRAESLRAELSGTLAEHRIELVAMLPVSPPAIAEQLLGLEMQRGTRADLRARGVWSREADGGGRWRAQVERVAVGPWDGRTGTPAAADRPATLAPPAWAEARDLRAELRFDRQGTLRTASAEPGRVQLADQIALRWDAVQIDLRDERADFGLSADLEAFAVAPLLARAMPTMGWAGDLRLAARVSLRAAERFEADVAFERRDGDLYLAAADGVQLFGLTEFRLALSARDGVWDFSPRFSGRSLGEIRGTLRARTTPERRWPDADAPVEGEILAHVADLGIWSHWVPPGWRLGGELRTAATVGGRFGAPTYRGELSGSGLAVRNLLQGVNVRDGQLRVVLAGDNAQVERFSARAGDGRVEITGGATFGTEPKARLQLEAERFRVLGRVDRQLIVSGRAEMALARDAGRLDGSFMVDEGLFDFGSRDAPSLDDDVTLRRPEDEDRDEAAPAAARPRRNFALGVDVDLGEKLRVRGRGVDTGLAGKVRLTNPAGRLAVNGTLRAEDGTYAAYGQKLEIERGLIAFSGPLDDTRLDILATRPNVDIKVGVQITGTVLLPRVRLYSDPELSDADKLSWLLLGREPEGLGRDDAAMIQRAAFAVMAGEEGAPTDAVLKNLGIDELTVRQSDGDTRETVVALGKQLSRRWYVGYERGLNATTGSWQLIYRVAQRLTIRAQSGADNSLDVIWVWRLHEAPREGGVRKSLPAQAP